MKDCLFCQIINKKIKAEIVYEDNDTLAFLDVRPRAPGHTMVLPKVHSQNILDLPDDKIEPLFAAVKKVTQILKDTHRPDGFTIGINQGQASGQAIDHLHIHIIPRWHNDGGGSIHSVVNNPQR